MIHFRYLQVLVSIFIGIAMMRCSDGRVKIARIDFNDVNLSTCVSDTTAVVFFKMQRSEAIILQIPPGLLKNQQTTEDISVPIGDGSSSSSLLVYRTFSKPVTKDYFCSKIPPTEPGVQKNISASGGKVVVSTQALADNLGRPSYEHTIRLENVLLEESGGGRVINERVYFGTFRTSALP